MSTAPDIMKGVNAAVSTPLMEDLSPDFARMATHCKWLLANGCDGLGILGTTGEATSFSVSERIRILEEMAAAGIPMIKAMPGTGAAAIPDTVELTRHAMSMGAGGVLMLPPFYYKNVSDEGVFAAYSEIIERVGDSRLRIYIYHFPQMSAVPVSLDVMGRLIERYPDTVVGAKDSSGDLDNMLAMIERFPGFAVFPGSESVFLKVLQAGGAGCITAASNLVSAPARKVYAAWTERGEVDEEADAILHAVREIVTAHGLFPAIKAILARHYDDPAWECIRPPLMALDDEGRKVVYAKMDKTGYELPAL